MKIKVTLEKSDIDSLHDTLFNALYDQYPDRDYTVIEIQKLWDTLPEDIIGSATQWGVDDSVVRDDIYEWIQDNKYQP